VSQNAPSRTPLFERIFAGHHDVLAALRSLRRSPGFVAIAVISLGLAIGLNTTTFALIDATEHPYVAYDRPEQLFSVVPYGWGRDRASLGHQMYLAMRDRADLFGAVVPYTHAWSGVIEANGHLLQGSQVAVGTGMFRLLGVQPFLGHVFNADRDDPADAGTAVISYGLWRAQYGGNPNLGRLTVSLNDVTYAVVGVMPPDAMGATGGEVWVPLPTTAKGADDGITMAAAIVRLKPGDTRARVKAQLDVLSERFSADYRGERALFDYRIESVIPRGVKPGDLPMTFALITWVMLVIACLNLANLMLARGLGRRREIAVRMAVGANGAAVMRYVFTECAVLAVSGGLWGVLLSLWGVKLAEHHMPPQAAALRLTTPHLNWRIVAFGMFVTATTVLLAGLVPALRARRTDVNEAMKDGGAGSTGRPSRTYRYLVIGEIALALFVLVGSTSAFRLVRRMMDHPPSYADQHSLSAFVVPRGATCKPGDTLSSFVADITARARAAPGVELAAASMVKRSVRSMVTSDQSGGDPVEAFPLVQPGGTDPGYRVVTPDYLRLLGVPVTAGRDFEPGDITSGAAIVNWHLAAQLWPFESPVGRLIKLGPAVSSAPWVRVVGVAGSRIRPPPDSSPDPAPDLSVVRRAGCVATTIEIRTTGQNPATKGAFYHALRASVPVGIVTEPRTPSDWYESNLTTGRLYTMIFTAFGLFALSLSTIGVYGVLNYAVGQRIREFAMRIALGALTPDVFRIVMRDALVMVLAGTGFGALFGLGFSILLASFAFGVRAPAADVWALVWAEAILVSVSVAACLGPARRASRADPLEIMRST
jgi:putative ABC transport system permease protein